MRFDRFELKRARKSSCFRLEDIARKTGLSAATVSNFETGKTEPTIGVIDRLAKALGIPPMTLIYQEEEDWR